MTFVICRGSGVRVGARFVRRYPAEPKDLRIVVCPRCWQNIPCSRLAETPVSGAYIIAEHAVKETIAPTERQGRK